MSRKALPVGTVMVLHALARGHRYGFDLLEQTGLTSGTVYPALERLERQVQTLRDFIANSTVQI